LNSLRGLAKAAAFKVEDQLEHNFIIGTAVINSNNLKDRAVRGVMMRARGWVRVYIL
jgi:hypothetical protein